jgi:hypothetical protein
MHFYENTFTDGNILTTSEWQMEYTVKPGYNDFALYDTSSIASDIVIPINSSLLTITLYSSVITTLVYNDTLYSVPFMTL